MIESRASREGWYDARLNGDVAVLQRMIQSVKTEDRDRIAEAFQKKTNVAMHLLALVSESFTKTIGKGKKKRPLWTVRSPGQALDMTTVAGKLTDQIQRAVESAARVSSHLEGGGTPPVMIHAASGASVNVTQLIKAVRGKGKEKIV